MQVHTNSNNYLRHIIIYYFNIFIIILSEFYNILKNVFFQ